VKSRYERDRDRRETIEGEKVDLYHPEFRYCPLCGGELKPTNLKENEPSRLVCGRCRFVLYLDPKVVACTILDLDGGIVLLKRDIEPQKGRWVIPGGYVDRGEKVEAAAIRETAEECGLNVGIRELLGVYSYPGQVAVVVVYVAEHISGEVTAGDETREARLFPQAHIPWEELAFQSTADALKDYAGLNTGKEKERTFK
jgi:8-oxo-dGTP diphosphatase